MLQNVEACEWLTGALRGLEVPNLDPIYANMRAVCILFLLSVFLFLKRYGYHANMQSVGELQPGVLLL